MLARLPQRTTLTLALLGQAATASARRCLSPSFFVYPSRHDDGGPCCDASLQVAPATAQHDEPFVNTVRGLGVDGMHEGHIPSSPSSFTVMLAKPLSPALISTTAPRHRAKTPTAAPR
jgi:hypothetical protein